MTNDELIKVDMSSKIMSIIREGTEKSGISLADIDKIMVCTGPGSFTGIRIGVTIAKTIAWALKKDIIGEDSFSLAYNIISEKNANLLIECLLEKNDEEVYWYIWDNIAQFVCNSLTKCSNFCKQLPILVRVSNNKQRRPNLQT